VPLISSSPLSAEKISQNANPNLEAPMFRPVSVAAGIYLAIFLPLSVIGQQVEVIANTVGMKLALIPAGEFLMGSPETELRYKGDHAVNEQQHRVRITKPFYLGVYEVTQTEYQAVMGNNPSAFSAGGERRDGVKGLDTSRFPVENVSWDDAQEFCRKLSQKEGKQYRLPTEAEWEYACRAGTTTPFFFGAACNGAEANCDGNFPYGTATKGPYLERTTTAGSYRANAFGLYDMPGNVWEWCADWYDEKYYTVSPVDNPPGPSSGSERIFRGGSWRGLPSSCRSANRGGSVPSNRRNLIGFRPALVP
jgi:formylglycine-generating enzyme required for sulfatase activity